MRVMVFVHGDQDSEAGVVPKQELLVKMLKFNEELVNAGVVLDGRGLIGGFAALLAVLLVGLAGWVRLCPVPRDGRELQSMPRTLRVIILAMTFSVAAYAGETGNGSPAAAVQPA
jgi:hypothetical protein